jgi:hypothetical protein
VLCPESEIGDFSGDSPAGRRYVDPSWGLEEIIAHLAGFALDEDVRVL